MTEEVYMSLRGRALAIVAIAVIVSSLAACGASAPTTLLERVEGAKKLVVSTDPKYPPQSELKADGTYEGFDIDVANEIGKRMGFAVEFTTPDWTAITAGGWGGRWDISVGSMSITLERSKVLDFSTPYYYTPAQMAASTNSGITTLEGLADKSVCSGEGTTYDSWLKGALDFGTGEDLGSPPAGITPTTLPTDTDCADAWKAGRFDWDGWLSSITTVQGAIDSGLPLITVGEPVFYEPLAVATDKAGLSTTTFMEKLNKVITDMHSDGTLSGFSQKWFGTDYTKSQ